VCYQDYVLGNGSAYNNAYFAVNYVNVFGGPGQSTVLPGSSGAPRATAANAALAALVAGGAAWALGAW
jgi:hypothetical protein